MSTPTVAGVIPVYRERVCRMNLGAHLNYATGWVMRVWREEEMDVHRDSFLPHRTQPDDDIFRKIQSYVQIATSPLDVAKGILSLERVNAVEIVDVTGAGEVLYKNWP